MCTIGMIRYSLPPAVVCYITSHYVTELSLIVSSIEYTSFLKHAVGPFMAQTTVDLWGGKPRGISINQEQERWTQRLWLLGFGRDPGIPRDPVISRDITVWLSWLRGQWVRDTHHDSDHDTIIGNSDPMTRLGCQWIYCCMVCLGTLGK